MRRRREEFRAAPLLEIPHVDVRFKMEIFTITSTIVAILTLIYGIDQNRKKREAESELQDILSRGRAPYLIPDHMDVRKEGKQGGNQIFRPWDDTQGKIEDGETVLLALENQGEEVRNVTDDWEDGIGISGYKGVISNDNSRSANLFYRFEKEKEGKVEKINITFETLDGIVQTHTYETIHGKCHFKRISPKSN